MAVNEKVTKKVQLSSSRIEEHIGYHLKRSYVHMIEQFHLEMKEFRLRPAEFSILSMLSENESVTAKKLSQSLNIAPPNLVSLIDHLEDRKLINKTVNEQDRRSQILKLTNSGETLLSNAQVAAMRAQNIAMKNLDSSDKEQLIEILRKLYD
jgi:DNA-binding MarR family transcriptional regulator